MTRLLEWLLSLEHIRLARDAPLSLRLASPPAPWMLAAGVVLVVLLVSLAYRMERVGKVTRWVLAFCRLSAILVVMGLASRPVLVLSRNHVAPSVVAVALDRSASMATADETADETSKAAGARSTRWASALRAASGDAGVVAQLAKTHEVGVWSFAESALPIATARGSASRAAIESQVASDHPSGAASDLASALSAILDAARGRRLAGVVLLSDGRQTSATAIDPVLTEAAERHVPVHVIALGSTEPRRDVALQGVTCESEAILRDLVAVQARLNVTGYDRPTPVVLELRDEAGNSLLAKARVDLNPAPAANDVELRFRPTRAGMMTLRLTVLPAEQDDDPSNNEARTMVRVHDRKLRVLYVESEPRFEYRYLKNTILRESTFESSILLLSAAQNFAQEGTHPIRRFPVSPEELNAYHVIILGDVDPRGDWIGPDALRLLTDFVSVRGGGLCFIAGERAMPFKLHNTALEKLLPIRIDPQFFGRYDAPLSEAFTPQLTAVGQRHRLFRFGSLTAATDASSAAGADSSDSSHAIAELPGWYWNARVAGAAPGAEVLAAHPTVMAGDEPMPLAVLGRYGNGRVFYLGSDDSWRWRRGRGEFAYDAFWVETIRLLARHSLLGPEQRWRLETERREVELGSPVRFRLTSLDAAATAERVMVQIRDAGDEPIETTALERLAPDSTIYAAEWFPPRAGSYSAVAQTSDEGAEGSVPGVTFGAQPSDAERRDPTADYAMLREIAQRTGGKLWRPGDSAKIAAALPDRSVLVPDDVTEPLWDTRLALLLFVLPISLEWIIRKTKGLA